MKSEVTLEQEIQILKEHIAELEKRIEELEAQL